jgi:hypothetical protein
MRKINIHLALDPRGLAYAREVNAGIRRITNSIIEFREASPMIPHVSLMMGELLEQATLEEVSRITREVASSQCALVLEVGNPYMESVKNRYVLSDVHAGEVYASLKKKLFALLKGTHLITESDETEKGHLTLGHVENHREEVQEYLRNVRAGFEMRCPAIEISDVGPRGTCVNSLFRLALLQI